MCLAQALIMKLDQFLKGRGMAATGGVAKHLINSGFVSVNGNVEKRRGRKLIVGDSVVFGSKELIVDETDPPGEFM